jgi:hypothetical protein
LIDIVQAQPYAPLHVRAASPGRTLHLVSDAAAVAPDAARDDADSAAPAAVDEEPS